MIIHDAGEAQRELDALISEASDIVGFTGAGISTNSGIPDFRSPGTAWKRYPPIPFQDFLASADARAEAWRRKFAMDDLYRGAQPNDGHFALTWLHNSGKMNTLITQNIDGLHEESGIPHDAIVELHGNGTYAKCLTCTVRHELGDVRRKFEASGKAPTCLCGGIVKTATIAFGQSMPQEAMVRAQQATLQCDLFLAIGSSLVVYPAAAFPALAKENGARLVIINRDETGLDEMADLVIRADISAVLAPYAKRLNIGQGRAGDSA